MPGRSLWSGAPRIVQIALSFTLVSLLWVLFRAPDLPGAMEYYGRLFGIAPVGDIAALVAGLVWRPYFIATLLIAAAIAWLAPTTLDWTHRLSAPKAVWSLSVFWLSALALSVQKFNPFIYFIF